MARGQEAVEAAVAVEVFLVQPYSALDRSHCWVDRVVDVDQAATEDETAVQWERARFAGLEVGTELQAVAVAVGCAGLHYVGCAVGTLSSCAPSP
jgi:hypothetical protein